MELKEANQVVSKLQEQQRKLHERIEELCCRYLNYKMKKHDEIFELRSAIDSHLYVIDQLTTDAIETMQEIGRNKKVDFSMEIQRTRDVINEYLR